MDLAAGTFVTPNVRLLRPLREGGMGSIWVAEHLTLRTEVAVKFISDELMREEPSMLERFEHEAALAAQIKSEHVVHTHDQGLTPDGRPYIVMELLDGNTLTEWIEVAGPLEPAEVVELVSQICKALTRAHKIGIVHRDIKTDNVFLVDSDEELFVKILDFGIAKHTRLPELDKRTKPGTIVGTPEFMSPEQMLADKPVDHQADLWALGVVAYYAMTGELPFQGGTLVALCLAVLEAKALPPCELNPSLPPGMDAWCARALAREPNDRFGSAREMADELQRLAATGAPAARSRPSRSRPSSPRSTRSGRGLDGPLSSHSSRRPAEGAAPADVGWVEEDAGPSSAQPFSKPPQEVIDFGDPSWTGKDTEPEAALPLLRAADSRRSGGATPTITNATTPLSRADKQPRRGRRALAWIAAAVAVGVGVAAAQLLESRGWTVVLPGITTVAPSAARSASMEPTATATSVTPDEVVTEATPPAPDVVRVPAGRFSMGCKASDDPRCDRDELPHHKVRLSAFEIDRVEVDVAKYARCVRAGRCTTDGLTEEELCNWKRTDRMDHPITCVDWHQASAYCSWVGMRLPTEAEWERAARGSDGRIYPWGDTAPSCKLAIMDDGGDGCGHDATWPVGSRPEGASPSGALDMAGNVWEWVGDYFAERGYDESWDRDPTGPATGGERAVRGGSWLSNDAADLRASERHGSPPSYRSYNLGFRCARAAPVHGAEGEDGGAKSAMPRAP